MDLEAAAQCEMAIHDYARRIATAASVKFQPSVKYSNRRPARS